MPSRILFEAVALVAPPRCLSCRAPVERAVDPVCGHCRRALPWLGEPRCPRCGLPAPCRPCPAVGSAFDRAWAPVAYHGPARALVAALKTRGSAAAARLMAAQIAAGVPPGLLEGAWLVPVPATPARRRARGHDHARRLATELARRTGRPLVRPLRRRGGRSAQTGAGRAARRAPGRVDVAARGAVPPRAVLVDDVHTTGATLDACARAVRDAGCEAVACVTYARTLRRAAVGVPPRG